MISFLTADRQTGKTTFLLHLIEKYGANNFWGFITPAVFENNKKTGINALLLPSQEVFSFATLAFLPLASPQTSPSPSKTAQNTHTQKDAKTSKTTSTFANTLANTLNNQNPKTHWSFSDSAIARINNHLISATKAFASIDNQSNSTSNSTYSASPSTKVKASAKINIEAKANTKANIEATPKAKANTKTNTKAKTLIIDELGPLELEMNEGITEALNILDNDHFENAIVVVRPELINTACTRWANVSAGGFEIISPGEMPYFIK